MVNATFFTKLVSRKSLDIPSEVANSLQLDEGDKIEVYLIYQQFDLVSVGYKYLLGVCLCNSLNTND